MACRDNLVFIGCVLLLFFCIPFQIDPANKTIEDEFNDYLKRYNKTYNETEYQRRLEIFLQSKKSIKQMNAENNDDSAFYGLTNYSDLLPLEFLFSKLINKHGNVPTFTSWLDNNKKLGTMEIPLSVDWREKLVTSDIVHQGPCGACWAFSVAETLESMVAITSKRIEKLSVQQMIDCSENNEGCEGGDMCLLLHDIVKNNIKIVPENEYPLRYKTDKCKNMNMTHGVQIKKYKCEFLGNNEQAILRYLAFHGPVSVAVNALSWQNYLGGIIKYHCESSPSLLNHAVQIVGYDINGPIPYYIVRNSWGKGFGENGYVRILIGKNICGIANKVATVYLE